MPLPDAVGPFAIVVSSLGLNLILGVCQGQEPVFVQALLRNPPLKASMKALSVGLPRRLKSSSTPFR